MSKWTGVSNLSLTLESGDESCSIYANGWNRIGVTITVEPTDEKGNSIEVDAKHLAGRLWLIDYVNESKLGWKGSSGWCYSAGANEFTAVPDRPGARSEAKPAVTTEAYGTRHVTFYVYCSPGVNRKSIGVRVVTDSGDTITSSQGGAYQSRVVLSPLTSVTYMRRDINWDYTRARTKEGGNTKHVSTEAWNYYLSLDAGAENYFVTFRAHGHYNDPGYEGMFAFDITPDDYHRYFRGGYVWYSEPHKSGTGTIVNFPHGNHWSDEVYTYDRANPERYLCLTWVRSTTTDFEWFTPNGPIFGLKSSYNTRIVAWDRYGNSGTFWMDGQDLDHGLQIYDHAP